MGERLGTDVLASNAIMMQFLFLAAYGLDGFAHAAEALCGQTAGEGSATTSTSTLKPVATSPLPPLL